MMGNPSCEVFVCDAGQSGFDPVIDLLGAAGGRSSIWAVGLAIQTVITTFPRACPSSSCRRASDVSLSVYVRPIIGVILAVSISCFRTTRSFVFGVASTGRNRWLTNRDNTSARTERHVPPPIQRSPPSPPTMTSVPIGVRARRTCDSDRFPRCRGSGHTASRYG